MGINSRKSLLLLIFGLLMLVACLLFNGYCNSLQIPQGVNIEVNRTGEPSQVFSGPMKCYFPTPKEQRYLIEIYDMDNHLLRSETFGRDVQISTTDSEIMSTLKAAGTGKEVAQLGIWVSIALIIVSVSVLIMGMVEGKE